MNDRKAICLNMIVKNEMANLERCLTAVAPHISCWVIGDTGSTDGSREFVRCFFAQRNIPGELYSYPFINFAQARNEALDRARASAMDFDYLLLVDADMELTVHAPAFSRDLTSAAYTVRQHHGITYRNIRLLRRDAQASREACDPLISEEKIPAEYRARVSCNRYVAAAKLGEIGTGPPTRDGFKQGMVLA
jgi:glycosyltransferase involved in cell wall biosynthesis